MKNIVIGKQFELPSTGMGNLGERLKFYGDTLSDITDKYDKRHKELTRNHYPSTVAVDDNQRHFISMMSTNLPELKWFPTKFKTKES
ncbi:hypothetical protein [Herbiconiux daphne]|uniref:Uncharacterized protein n=1 Tax=Herbiconiux daphne TaxID=2970914 RepID=A0ABT2H9H5_9MICO|nr:hypothetical protein [Herbiconiux daphne]MCS5736582.1 hypothetical protein [Herbiconiux daphne]